MIINGNLNLHRSSIVSLGKITEVKGGVQLRQCENLKDLGDLEKIQGNLILYNCKFLKSLGKLKEFNFMQSIRLSGSGITKDYVRKEKPWLMSVCSWD